VKKCCAAVIENTLIQLALFATTTFMTEVTFANPVVENIAAGQVTISQVPNSTVVNQSSQKAIINWHSFNIGSGEKTHFQQPAGGIALNRINPNQGASQIYGQLTATGKIILVNQAGIYFGPGSHVDVGGIIASTSDISNANFLAGKYSFDQPSPYNGSVINEGKIRAAQNGLVALIGTGVRNDGTIEAHMGSVVLASGNKFTVDLSGDGLVNFTVDEATPSAGVDHHGNKLKDGVSNNGVIVANGGTIIMTARTARGVVDNAINMRGVAQARSVSERNGTIILDGGDGNVRVAGRIDVSGKHKNTRGGSVKILARNVHLESPTVIDASGYSGGGEVLIGGNAQGKGPEQNAYSTQVDKGVTINADAIQNGNGGKVVVWSDHDTEFHGSISARGGLLGGDGGSAETSGQYLDVTDAHVNLLAAKGNTGTWLLDPTNLTISSSPTSHVTTSGNTFTGDSNSTTSTLNVTDLTTALSTANIIVQTTGGGTGLGSGDIIVGTPVTWSTATTLTLSAYRTIQLNNAITDMAAGNVILRADNTGTGTGTITGSGVITTTPGGTATFYYNPSSYATPTDFSANVSGATLTAYMLVNNVTQLQNMNTNLAGNYALGNNIDATATSGWNGGAGFVPVGNSTTAFTGSFNGQNNVITNLFINLSAQNDVGLFGRVSGSGISNVGLVNPDINGNTNVGALVGSNTANIQNSYVSGGSVTAIGNAGGLIGLNNGGTLSNLYNTSTVDAQQSVGGIVGWNQSGILQNSFNQGSINGINQVGGIAGENDDTIQNSHNQGTVAAPEVIGGIAGENFGTIQNSYNQGTIIGLPSSFEVGGIAGSNDGTIQNSYNQGAVSASGTQTGGIAGLSTGIIEGTYNQGSVSSNDVDTGGIVGQNQGILLENSYNLGPVTGTDFVGGIAGENFDVINNTYNAGYIASSIGSSAIGGLVGSSGSVSSSYWDTQTSGLSTSSGGGTPETTAQLQSGIPAGFSSGTWGVIANASYPYLLALYPTTPRAISGFIPGGSSTATGLANTPVQIAANGNNLITNALTLGNVTTGNNGYYYFIEPTGIVADQNALLTYLTSGGSANAVTRAPSLGGSLFGLNMSANTVIVGDGSTRTLNNTNALLASAKGGLSSNILYTTSGTTDVILNANVNLVSSSSTTYNLDGNITASGTGNIIFEGPVSLATGTHSINVENGNTTFNNTVTGVNGNLILNGASVFNATVNDLSTLTVNSPTTINTATISTLGSQQYNDVLLGRTALFTSNAGNIDLNGTLTGGTQSLTLTGGTGGNHLFKLNDIASLNTLTVNGNPSVTNTLDFSGYSVPIVLTLSPPSGNVLNAGTLATNASVAIGSFTQIQEAIGTNNLQSQLFLPSVPGIRVTYTNAAHTSGIINDPFVFINFILQNPPAPTPTPTPIPVPTILPANIISGTTAFIVNNKNMEILVDGLNQYQDFFTNAPWVDANITDLIKQQNAMDQDQNTKWICHSIVKNPTLIDCRFSLSALSLETDAL